MSSNRKFNISSYLKRKNAKRFSIFFLVAFIFLIFSKLSNDYTQNIKLRVQIANTQDEIVLKKDSTNIIDAFVKAKGFSMLSFLFSNTEDIVLDSKTDVTTRPDHFIFDVQSHKFLIEEQLGKSYDLLTLSPDTLNLYYSKLASKKVPLVLESDVKYSVGYDIKGEFSTNIDSIKIVGSANEVDSIHKIKTKKLILNDVNKDISEHVEVNVSKYKNIEVFPKVVEVKAKVTRFTEGTIEVPVTLVNKPKDLEINFFPKTVSVAYYVDLENYKLIKKGDFIVECDFMAVEENQTYLVPRVTKKPEFIKRANIKQNRIDFIKL